MYFFPDANPSHYGTIFSLFETSSCTLQDTTFIAEASISVLIDSIFPINLYIFHHCNCNAYSLMRYMS